MITIKTILKRIDSPCLTLQKGDGYYYFVYDSGDLWDTHSVYTNALNHMSLEQWVEDGKDFINRVEGVK
jgi:hypothetical protein